MATSSISLFTALAAGVVSFFSPCIVPLVPIYLGYMTGTTVNTFGSQHRARTVLHAVLFVCGFSVVFVALGVLAGLFGQLTARITPILLRVGGVLLIIFGLHMTGIFSLPWLNMEKHLELKSARRGLWDSFLVGVVFALGWTPCIGPVLTTILMLAANSHTALTGAALLSAYSLGLGLPFIVVGGLLDVATPWLRRIGRSLRVISIIGGALLVVMGILLLGGWFGTLVFWVNAHLAAL